jgi:Tol biopolymer transport system component
VKLATNGSKFDPLWDPAGKRIIVNNYRAPTSKIYLIDLEKDEVTFTYETSGTAVAKDWTPNGELITAFINTNEGEGIWIIDPTNIEQPAFMTTGHEATWSPDGSQLAVLDHSPSIQNTEKLRIIEIQSKREDIAFEVKGNNILATDLSWSRDGKHIAFSLSTNHQASQIYILDVNTKTASQLTHDKNDNWSPTWSSNNQLISYVSRSPTTFENLIVISTIDGKCKVSLPDITDVWSVAWSPKGNQLLFSWRNSNIYLADLEVVLGRDISVKGIDCP